MRTTVLFVALLVAAFARSKGPNIMCGLCEVFAAVLEGKFERSDKDIGKHITNICAFLADGNKKAEAKCNEVFSDEFTNMAKNFISSNVSDHVCKRLALC
uniref:Saposin B-type domain-containing protein n=1 Tax=Ascaris lumbricoides TaxID=6252 RepID=A0A0M3I3D1_ASCLU